MFNFENKVEYGQVFLIEYVIFILFNGLRYDLVKMLEIYIYVFFVRDCVFGDFND